MSRRPLVGLLVAEAVSMTGSRLSIVAGPWLVLTTTGSAARVGVVAFAQLLPMVLAGLFGGPLVERIGPRRTAIAGDAVCAAAIGLVPLLHATGHLTYGLLIVAVAIGGAAGGLSDTAKRALLPRVIEAAGTPMTRGVALHDGVNRVAGLAGLPLGGVLVAVFGPAGVLAVDAVSFAVCAIVVAATVPATKSKAPAPEPYLPALREGLGYFRKDPLVAAVVGMLFFTNMVDQAHAVVFVPAWVYEHGAPAAALGLFGGAFGLGAVLGNLLYLAIAPRLPRYLTFALCFLIGGSPRLFAMAASDEVWPIAAVGLGAGFVFATINPILSAVAYERIPAHLHGRVLGAIGAAAAAGIPLGGLFGGYAVERLGRTPVLLASGGIYLAVTLLPFVQRTWRELDREPVSLASREPVATD